ncbi:MAG: hypothetical protein WCX28_05815 [Bacteriovoracaceae bacterium]|nr:hypothetical protein [Bacteroidota bacterium]
MIEKIVDTAGNEIALIIRKDFHSEKTAFFSKNEYSQQLGIISYPKDGSIKPHYHNKVQREVQLTQEVLVIRRGKVQVNLFDKGLSFLCSVVLSEHDVIFLISGGHGFDMLEDSEMLEVKQGPYSGVSNDKTHFSGTIGTEPK